VKKVVLIAACLALSAAVAFAAPSGGAPYFVAAKSPTRAKAKSFVNGTFTVTVTCQKACRATATALIRADAARRLGFSNVKGKLVLIGTGKATLRAGAPTKIALVATAQARQRLRAPVQVFGSAKGVPTQKPTVNYSIGWSTTLT